MTCEEFSHRVDLVLSGEVRSARVEGRATSRHLAECSVCASVWERVIAFREHLRGTDGAHSADPEVDAARERLRAAFSRRGQPVVRYGSLRTPVGLLFVGLSDHGVCDVTFGDPDEDVYRERLLERAPEVFRDPKALEPVLTELDAYFQGSLERFTIAVDLRSVTEFTWSVLRATQRIRFGRLLSYGEVARRIGSPRASRAVGGALARNPVLIVVPCHRVVAHGGRLGGFTGGLDVKRTLLQIEGHPESLPT